MRTIARALAPSAEALAVVALSLALVWTAGAVLALALVAARVTL